MPAPDWETVGALQEEFNARRSEFHRDHPDKWLVFTGDGVVRECDDERAAFTWAYEQLTQGTFVVDQATEHEHVLSVSFNALH